MPAPLRMLGLLCATAFSAAAQTPPDNSWMRLPEATVPLLKKAPSIDGLVGASEWNDAAVIGLLAVDTNGVADKLRRRVFLGYDAERLYLAVQIQRPPDALVPQTPATADRVDTARAGDFLEVAFAPDRTNEKAVAFLLYANGAFADAKLPAGKDFPWNAPGFKSAAHLTDSGWEGEFSVPFADLGLQGPPKEDELWGFDAVDNRSTPAKLMGHWAFRGSLWKSLVNFGNLRFAPVPAARLEDAGQLAPGRLGMSYSVVNTTPVEQPTTSSFQLFKRKAGAAGGTRSFLDNIENGMGQDSQVEFTKGVKLPDQVAFSLDFYDAVGAPMEDSSVIPVGQQKTFGFQKDTDLGEYLIAYEIKSASRVLTRGAAVIAMRPPLPLHLEPYWLYSEIVDIVIEDTSALVMPPGTVTKARIFHADAPGKTLSEAQVTPPANAKTYKVPLSVKGLPPGGYRIETSVITPDGKTIASDTTDVNRPAAPEWFRSDAGNKIAVPKPWTPVEATPTGLVKIWNRTYDLSTFLPRSVTSGGAEILAAPVALDVTIDGKAQTFRVDSLKLTEAKPEKATYAAELSSDKATLKGTVTVEFDGFTWYDVTLAPKASGSTLDAVTLEAQIKPEFSELFGRHKFIEDSAFPAPVPEKNAQPGIVQDSLMPFTPLLWIGKEEGGLIFSTESMQDWSVDRSNAVMETTAPAKDKPATMQMHFVQKPVPFDRPRKFAFSIQGTPIREPFHDYRNLFIVQTGGVVDDEELIKQNAAAGTRVMVFYYDWRGNSKTELGGTPERPVVPGQSEKLKRAVELVHKHGMKAIVYTGWGINAVSPNWQDFGYELGKYPISNKGWGTYEQSAGLNGGYADYMAWHHADLAREYGVDGVLYDSLMNLVPDSNLRIGNGWVDETGRVRPTYSIRATRDLVRRVYTVYEGEVRPDGFIYNHTGSMWNLNMFANVMNRGEGRPMVALKLRDAWQPLEEYRAEYSGEPFGIIQSNEQNDHKKLPMSVNNHSAVTLLHGTFPKTGKVEDNPKSASYDRYRRPTAQLWKTWAWLPMDGTEKKFLYFKNQQAVVPENKKLLSSAFVSADGKRAIIVVSNLDKEELKAQKVRLDFKTLGMAPGPYKVEDAIIGGDIPLTGDTVALDLLDERYRLLKVTAGNP